MKNEIISVIDIGSSSIRMTIYEKAQDNYAVIESVRQPVRLGKDCFYDGRISRATIDESIRVLKKYKKLCKEYKVKKIKAVATTAVRESSNYDIFLENIQNILNIEVEILSAARETEFLFSGLNEIINSRIKKEFWAIIEIGTGNVELTIINQESIIFSRSMALGILKLKQMYLKEFSREEANFNNFLKLMIQHELQNIKRYLPDIKINSIFAIGSEIQEIPKIISRNFKEISKISKTSLEELLLKIQNYSEQEITHKINIPHDISETFMGALIVFLKILDFMKIENIFIPQITLRDGIINSLVNGKNYDNYYANLEKQLRINSLTLGRFLNFDENHAIKVTELACRIFDQTADIHRLGKKERCYLVVSSLLHDIGSSLSYSAHHKHSLYIIKAQDFFSLNPNEICIIANSARYHRKAGPKRTHPDYMALSSKDRMIVMKIASILRIADSLDNTHLQLVKDVIIKRDGNYLKFIAVVKDKFFSEAYSFKSKKRIFENFFGIKIKLVVKSKNEK